MMMTTQVGEESGRSRPAHAFDLTDVPVLGKLLHWQHVRTALQLPLLLLAGLMIWDGLLGPQLAPKNLATVLTWVHYRGLVVLALLLVGNLFCTACPFMLVRNLSRHLFRPERMWPRRLRNKWMAVGLFASMLFVYELFDLWATPLWTAWLIVGYFAGALITDSLFRGANFCKYLCPLGQFNFISSLISPLEVQVRSHQICAGCRSKACITGRAEASPQSAQTTSLSNKTRRSEIPGCQLWLFQQRKAGNMDCTFCLDCLHACPFDNVGLSPRLPASELWSDTWRSGIGRFSQRTDLAALIVLFAFGAVLNAFAMVTPVYSLEAWLADLLGTGSEALVLVTIFVTGLILLPLLLLAMTGWLSRQLAGAQAQESLVNWVTRYAYTLVPLGFGVWLAHYAFHFLSGFWTFVPVVQSFVSDVSGIALFGTPRWDLGALLPMGWLYPLDLGFLGLGWFGSLLVAYRLSQQRENQNPWPAFVPWAGLLTILLLAAVWLMGQPMEMRGTFLAG